MAEHENNGSPLKDKDVGAASTADEGVASGNGQAPPVLVEVPNEISPGSYRKHKRLALAGQFLVMVCYGVVTDPFSIPETRGWARFPCGLLWSFFVFLWCYFDALELQYQLSKTMKICLVVVAAAAFPVYAFRSRGLAGFKTVGWAILFFLLSVVVGGIGAWISCGIKYALKIAP